MFRMSVFNWDTFIEDEIKIMKIGLTFKMTQAKRSRMAYFFPGDSITNYDRQSINQICIHA